MEVMQFRKGFGHFGWRNWLALAGWPWRGRATAGARPFAKNAAISRSADTVAEMLPGETRIIAELVATSHRRIHLMEMGLTPGTRVKVIRVASFGGPLDIQVRGYRLSLRRDEAAAVLLAPEQFASDQFAPEQTGGNE